MGIRGLTSTVTKLTKLGVALASVNLLVSCTPRILEPELPPDFNASSAFLQLISITPGTHGSNLNPTVRGASTLPIATSVQLFSNATCTTPLASGAYGSFVNPGLSVPAAANSTVAIYGIAYINSGATQITPCTFLTNYTHDNVNPVVTLTSPVNGSTLNSSQVGSVNFSGSCTENGRPVQITGSTVATFTCAGGSFSGILDLSALADGALNFTATQTDLAGNSGASSVVNVTKDAGIPTVAWTSPAANSFVNLSNVAAFAVSGTCSENGRNVVISGAASATVVCAAGAWSTTLDLSAAAQGSITLTANHSDAASNAATPASRSFIKDTLAPTVAISSPAAGSNITAANVASFAVSGTCSENTVNVVISGDANATVACASGSWSANLNFSAAADGTVSINVNHSDLAGNAATQATRSFNKDASVPTVAFTAPPAGSYANLVNSASFAVSGTCSENGRNVVISGAASATVSCAAGAWSANLNLSAVAQGAFTLYADHSDAGGNNATQASLALSRDSIAPTLGILSPAVNAFINAASQGSFTVTGTCNENGRNVVISGAASATVVCLAGGWTANLDFTSEPNGSVTINVNHSDLAGNPATQASRTFVKDASIATVSFSSPADGAFITPSNMAAFTISGACSENGRDVVIGGAASATVTCTAGSWSSTFDLSALADGTASFTANHSDAAGNNATQANRNFTKNSGLPAVAFSSPASGSYINSSNASAFAITGTCTENGRDVLISGAASVTVSCSAGTWSATLDLSAAANGSVTLFADHSNAVGTNATQASRTFNKVSDPGGANSIQIAGGASHTNLGTVTLTLHSDNYTSQMYITNTAGCASGGTWEPYNTSKSGWGLGQTNAVATVYARYMDIAGNQSACVSDTIIHDDVIPTVAITAPAANSYVNISNVASFAVSGTCSEDTRNVVIGGAASATVSCSAGTWSANLDFTAAGQGNVTININHSDAAANNATQDSRIFIKDTVAPTLAISTYPASINNSNVSSWAVSGTCGENGQTVTLRDTGVVASATCTGGAWSVSPDLTAKSEGNFTFFARIADVAGNVTDTGNITVTKDTGTPTVAITSPAANSYANASNYTAWTVSGTCSDNGQAVSISAGGGAVTATPTCTAGTWTTNLNLTAISDGTFTVVADHSDSVGNTATQASASFNKDIILPSAPSISIAGGAATTTVNPVALTLAATGASEMYITNTSGCASGGAWEAYSTSKASWTLGQTNATATVYVKYRDAASNESSCVNDTIVHDTVAPTVAITSPAANSYANASNYTAWTVSGTCSEDGRTVSISAGGGAVTASPACSSGTWTTNLNLTAITDGAFTVTANHSDLAGNNATQDSRSFNKDIGISTLAVTSPTNGGYITTANQAAFAVSGTCSENGRAVGVFFGDGTNFQSTSPTCTGGTYSTTLNLTSLNSGSIQLNVNHSDLAGNAATEIVYTFTKDVSAPTVAITSPAANSYANASNYTAWTVSGTCSENGRTVSISAGGGAVTASPACSGGAWTTNLNLTAISDGAFTVLADHSDLAGNNATQDSRTFNKDIVGITLTTNSTTGSVNTGTISRTIYTTGASSVSLSAASTTWTFTGTATCTTENIVTVVANSEYRSDLTGCSGDGTAYLSAIAASIATDSAGNTSAAWNSGGATNVWTVDNTAPTLTITSPAANTWCHDNPNYTATLRCSTFRVQGTCSENGRAVSVSAGGGAATGSTTCSAGAWTVDLNANAVADGSYTFLADHSDLAGNNATQQSRTFRKDTVVPTVTITSPNGGETLLRDSASPLTYTRSDSGSGFDGTTTIRVDITYNNGGSYTVLSFEEADSGTYNFTPTVSSTQTKVLIMIRDLAGNQYFDESNAVFTVNTGTVPTTPSGLTATASPGSVFLSWTASTGVPAPRYEILRGTASGSYSVVATNISNTFWDDAFATRDVTYYYAVRATNSNGTSANSNEATAFFQMTPTLALDFTRNTITPQVGDQTFLFSRTDPGYTATHYGVDGLLRFAPHNFLLQANAFNTSWTLGQATVSANMDISPTGATDADRLIENTSNNYHQAMQSVSKSTVSVPFTASVYAKEGSRRFLAISVSGTNVANYAQARYDLQSGTVVTSLTGGTGFSITSTSVQAVGNNWYRLILSGTTDATNSASIWIALMSNSTTLSYAGTNGNYVSVWGAQLEQNRSVSPLLATTAAPRFDGPRYDYHPVTKVHRGIRFEQNATNRALHSEAFDNAVWAISNSSISANTSETTDPMGGNAADKIVENTSFGYHMINQSITKSNQARNIAFSAYIKRGTRDQVGLQMDTAGGGVIGTFNLNTVTKGEGIWGAWTNAGSKLEAVGNGWYRATVWATADTNTAMSAYIMLYNTSTSEYTGNGTGSYYLFGAQVEEAAMSDSTVSGTSYIPTSGSTVTRNGEHLQTSGALGGWNSTTGTWYIDFGMDQNSRSGSSGGAILRAHTGTSFGNNDYMAGASIGLGVGFGSFSGGFRTLSSWDQWEEGGITNNDDFKLAFTITNNTTLARLNGSAAVSPNTTAAMTLVPTVITMGAAASDLTQPFNGWIREARFYNFTLTASELASITAATQPGFKDDFEDPSMLSRWVTAYSSAWCHWCNKGGTHTFTINENSQQLKIAQTWSHNYDGYISAGNTYNFTGKIVVAELIEAGRNIQSDNNNSGCGNETTIGLIDPVNDTTVKFGPKQYLADGQYLNVYAEVEAPWNNWTEYNSTSSTAYTDNPAQYRFFRIRHDASNDRIYLDYSSNGWAWTNHANFAKPAQINLNSVRFVITSGSWCFDASFNGYTTAVYDNFSTNAPQN